MNKKYFLIFSLGFLSCALVIFVLNFLNTSIPFITGLSTADLAPTNRIKEDNIFLYDDQVVLNISNATISNYASTGSMKPLIDDGTSGIRIKPKATTDVSVGDIITFRISDRLVVHRVVGKGSDENGIYFVTKGDRNFFKDDKIRFEDIEYVTIGILW